MAESTPPDHGGRLRRAAERYQIDLSQWVDLSTGINPNGWPVPEIPPDVWRRLPEPNDGFELAAKNYYGTTELIPTAGSQAAIQALPKLRPLGLVGLPDVGYAEHHYAWQKAGHQTINLEGGDPGPFIDQLDVLLVINPNNPTGKCTPVEQLLEWHARLARRGGWLVVDEAFVDVSPEFSLASRSPLPGLIVLRSLGKFFGLAGIRSGFVLAEPYLLKQLQHELGPWSVTGPTRFIAKAALEDASWQSFAREKLLAEGKRLNQLLSTHDLTPSGNHPLFQWVKHSGAEQLFEGLAQYGILVRYFDQPKSLRFGLPHDEAQWTKLESVLQQLCTQTQGS